MKIIKSFLIMLISFLVICGGVSAEYSYRIPNAQTTVEIESDGSMTIFVEYEFENLGQAIDFVDIGLPGNNYSLKDITVQLNGEVNTDIKVTKADYELTGLRYGISLEMGKYTIQTGASGTISVTIPNYRKNLFNATSETMDEKEVEFAGFQFSPNYFGSKYTKGNTNYSFIIVFPLDAGDGDVYYYEPEKWPGEGKPEAWLDEDGCVVYEWYSEKADMHTAYTFGGKFIKSALTSDSNIVKDSGGSSGGSGKSAGIDWGDFFANLAAGLTCIAGPAIAVVGVILSIVHNKKEKVRNAGKYFPPQIKTDGEGIKRGLTAVEAAVLLEVDLERVLSMILYGLAKKNVIQVKSLDPVDVEIEEPLPDNLNDYEKDFIAALQEPGSNKKQTMMRDSMHRLILSVSKKVEGFSLKETREYYQSICDKAWSQVEAADTPELKSKLLGDNFGWAMLQDEPEKRVESTFSNYDYYPPTWWWRVDPVYRRSYYHPTPSGSSSSSSSSSEKRSSGSSPSTPTPMPVLPGAMFARSLTSGVKSFANSLVGNTDTFKSAVKNRSNPTPVSSVSSSSHRHGGGGSSSGGSHSSCACACACDSCACACAGGGR